MCLINYVHAMKTYGGMEVKPTFLTSTVPGGEWSASRPGRFTSGIRVPGTHWIDASVGPRAGQDVAEKIKIKNLLTLPAIEPWPSSPLLYRLLFKYAIQKTFFFNFCGGTLGTAATTGLLYKPRRIGEGDCGEIGGMKIVRGNRTTRRKPAPAPLCPPQIPRD
jgi:hypothetical protein